MSETDAIQNRVSLSDRDVWIIDDDIPIDLLEPRDESMVTGDRPIDRGALRTLVHLREQNDRPVKWSDQRLQELCKELVDKAGRVTAFRYPEPAILHLRRGTPIPDVIIFDWQYRGLPEERVRDSLRDILAQCLSVVQVYTTLDTESIVKSLKSLESYGSRLEQPRPKAETSAQQLVEAIESKLKSSLPARLASEIRRSALIATEEVLVRIDDLPFDVAVRLMVGKPEKPPSDVELVELLSTKIGDALKSTKELTEAVRQYALNKGKGSEQSDRFVEEMVNLLAANVREHIQHDGWLYEVIQSAWAKAGQKQKAGDDDTINETIRKFFAFRVYDQPGDDRVRTGDVVALPTDEGAQDPPGLHLVLTPPCDLVGFWKKTRGVLTLAKMYPMTVGRGVARITSYGNNNINNQVGNSPTARNPIWLPSIPISADKWVDYALFVHEIDHWDCDPSGKIQSYYSHPLTYSRLKEELELTIQRKCRVSEPFLSGVLAKLGEELFGAGVPDFPDEEKTRLMGLPNE